MATPLNVSPSDRPQSGQPVSGTPNGADEVILTPGLSLKDSIAQAKSTTRSLADQLTADLDIGLPPLLPTGNQVMLDKWAARLLIPSSIATPSIAIGTGAMVGGPILTDPAEKNPYLEPGIMAILAPMMAELGKIFMEIQLQSAATEVKMMQATLVQAKESKDLSTAAGDARAQQLEQDAQAHAFKAAGAIINAVTAGISLGMTAYGTTAASKAGDKAVLDANTERAAKIPPQPVLTPGEELSTRATASSQEFQKWHGYTQALSTIVQSSVSAVTETKEADVAREKSKLEGLAAQAQGLASLLDRLTGTLQSSEQKASEEGKAASQAWQGVMELMKSMAQLATQFGSRN